MASESRGNLLFGAFRKGNQHGRFGALKESYSRFHAQGPVLHEFTVEVRQMRTATVRSVSVGIRQSLHQGLQVLSGCLLRMLLWKGSTGRA